MPAKNASTALETFIHTFADPAYPDQQSARNAVRDEIKAYWDKNGLTDPQDLYNHLIDNRVNANQINPDRAVFLKAQFRDSFAPEHTTGYYAKHRAPLIDELTAFYTRLYPDRPVFRVEGDIGNLGGLNSAMREAAYRLQRAHSDVFAQMAELYGIEGAPDEQAIKLGRIKADEVIGTITALIKHTLEETGTVQAIRKGGDEITFVVAAKEGRNIDDVRAKLGEAQFDVSDFARLAGLQDIPHLKYPDDPLNAKAYGGVSIGLEAVPAGVGTPLRQQMRRDAGILEEKSERAKGRSGRDAGETEPDIAQIEKTLNTYYNELKPPREGHIGEVYRYVPGAADSKAKTPEEARLRQMQRGLKKLGEGKLSATEQHIVNGTHKLTAKIDEVTDLPIFANMQGEQLPHFMERYGKAAGAKLVHIDCSNMAGGNKLGTPAGDAMARVFAESIARALKKSTLLKLQPYLAVKPGGKFALLVPGGISPQELQALQTAIQSEVDRASVKALPLSAEAKDIVRETHPEAPLEIRMADIKNPKTELPGVDVSMSVSQAFTRETPKVVLGAIMESLEAETERQYQETVAQRKREEGGTHVERTEAQQPRHPARSAAGRGGSPPESSSGEDGQGGNAIDAEKNAPGEQDGAVARLKKERSNPSGRDR